MSQAGRTRYFARSATRARSARRGGEKNKALLAHKAPVMQATLRLPESSSTKIHFYFFVVWRTVNLSLSFVFAACAELSDHLVQAALVT